MLLQTDSETEEDMDTCLTNKNRDHVLLDNSWLFQLHQPVKYSIQTAFTSTILACINIWLQEVNTVKGK